MTVLHVMSTYKYIHSGPNYGLKGEEGGLVYIGGTRTYDNLRCSGPLKVEWTDRYNFNHIVTVDKGNAGTTTMTIWVPAGSSIYWSHCNGEGKDRTGFDAVTKWVEVTFSWQEGGWLQNDFIRLGMTGYTYANTKTYEDDWARVEAIANLAESAANVIGTMVEARLAIAEAAAAEAPEREFLDIPDSEQLGNEGGDYTIAGVRGLNQLAQSILDKVANDGQE